MKTKQGKPLKIGDTITISAGGYKATAIVSRIERVPARTRKQKEEREDIDQMFKEWLR